MITAAVGILSMILAILIALFLYIAYTDKHIEQVFEAMKRETYNPRPAAHVRHGVPHRRRLPAHHRRGKTKRGVQ